MIDEKKVLVKIAEQFGDNAVMSSTYAGEENVAYACGYADRALLDLKLYVEQLAEAEMYETDEEGNLVPKKIEAMIRRKDLVDAIEIITSRMELYMKEIADCEGDQARYDKLQHLIAEDQAILDILVKLK